MMPLHGGRGLVVGGLTWAAAEISDGGRVGDTTAIIVALIGATALTATSVGGPLLRDWYLRRRSVDHIAEAQDEQSTLSNRLMTELEKVRGELEWERRERKRAERERDQARGHGGNQRRTR